MMRQRCYAFYYCCRLLMLLRHYDVTRVDTLFTLRYVTLMRLSGAVTRVDG